MVIAIMEVSRSYGIGRLWVGILFSEVVINRMKRNFNVSLEIAL